LVSIGICSQKEKSQKKTKKKLQLKNPGFICICSKKGQNPKKGKITGTEE
jgi:hypothetical protein